MECRYFLFEGNWLKNEIKINNPNFYSILREIISKENEMKPISTQPKRFLT